MFALIGLLVAADPEAGRDFFARQLRFLSGDGAGRRYRRLPPAVFRALGVALMLGGVGFWGVAAGGG